MWPVFIAVLALIAGPLSGAFPTALIHRAGLKTASAEIFILGLPLLFRNDVDSGTDLSVQFVVSGAEPGSYYVGVSNGRCSSGQGDLKEPGLTIYCNTDSWTVVGRGELSPERAVDGGLLRVSGSAQDFSRFFRCFRLPTHRVATFANYPTPASRSPSKTLS
jgi:hypothetical protein